MTTSSEPESLSWDTMTVEEMLSLDVDHFGPIDEPETARGEMVQRAHRHRRNAIDRDRDADMIEGDVETSRKAAAALHERVDEYVAALRTLDA